jgi:hypothetical protein
MENVLFLLILASLLLLVIGLISPKVGLFWYREKRTRKKSAEIYGMFIVIFIILFGLWLTA